MTNTATIKWEQDEYSGSQSVQLGDYRITESALGIYFVQLLGRHSGAPIGDARLTYTLQDALQLAGAA